MNLRKDHYRFSQLLAGETNNNLGLCCLGTLACLPLSARPVSRALAAIWLLVLGRPPGWRCCAPLSNSIRKAVIQLLKSFASSSGFVLPPLWALWKTVQRDKPYWP